MVERSVKIDPREWHYVTRAIKSWREHDSSFPSNKTFSDDMNMQYISTK